MDGMHGSLHCVHTAWKNCPKAWQGNFAGKEGNPTIVLEAISDYHLWFWHASCGHAETLGDQNTLNLSPFLDSLTNGHFKELEERSGVVPHKMLEEQFPKMFMCVDGIYPQCCRFVKGFKEPITREEQVHSD